MAQSDLILASSAHQQNTAGTFFFLFYNLTLVRSYLDAKTHQTFTTIVYQALS
jgi:hypothetical protein